MHILANEFLLSSIIIPALLKRVGGTVLVSACPSFMLFAPEQLDEIQP